MVTDTLIRQFWHHRVSHSQVMPGPARGLADEPFFQCDNIPKLFEMLRPTAARTSFAELGFAAFNDLLRAVLRVEPLLTLLHEHALIKFNRLLDHTTPRSSQLI